MPVKCLFLKLKQGKSNSLKRIIPGFFFSPKILTINVSFISWNDHIVTVAFARGLTRRQLTWLPCSLLEVSSTGMKVSNPQSWHNLSQIYPQIIQKYKFSQIYSQIILHFGISWKQISQCEQNLFFVQPEMSFSAKRRFISALPKLQIQSICRIKENTLAVMYLHFYFSLYLMYLDLE